VDFRVQNITERASRNGSLIFKVVWKQLGAGHDKIEDTWESLGNLKHMEPRILENFLAKHDIAYSIGELAAKKGRDRTRPEVGNEPPKPRCRPHEPVRPCRA
jgi:hypothetical protein